MFERSWEGSKISEPTQKVYQTKYPIQLNSLSSVEKIFSNQLRNNFKIKWKQISYVQKYWEKNMFR